MLYSTIHQITSLFRFDLVQIHVNGLAHCLKMKVAILTWHNTDLTCFIFIHQQCLHCWKYLTVILRKVQLIHLRIIVLPFISVFDQQSKYTGFITKFYFQISYSQPWRGITSSKHLLRSKIYKYKQLKRQFIIHLWTQCLECTHQLRILSHATKIHHKRLFEDENLYMQKMFKSLTNVAKKEKFIVHAVS